MSMATSASAFFERKADAVKTKHRYQSVRSNKHIASDDIDIGSVDRQDRGDTTVASPDIEDPSPRGNERVRSADRSR